MSELRYLIVFFRCCLFCCRLFRSGFLFSCFFWCCLFSCCFFLSCSGFFAAGFLVAGFFFSGTAAVTVADGDFFLLRVFPYDPKILFPFVVLLSPFPIVLDINKLIYVCKYIILFLKYGGESRVLQLLRL